MRKVFVMIPRLVVDVNREYSGERTQPHLINAAGPLNANAMLEAAHIALIHVRIAQNKITLNSHVIYPLYEICGCTHSTL